MDRELKLLALQDGEKLKTVHTILSTQCLLRDAMPDVAVHARPSGRDLGLWTWHSANVGVASSCQSNGGSILIFYLLAAVNNDARSIQISSQIILICC